MSGSVNTLFMPGFGAPSQPNTLLNPTQQQAPPQAGGSWAGPDGQQWPLTLFPGAPDNPVSWLGPLAAGWLGQQGAPATDVISAAAGTPAGAGLSNPYQSILDAGSQQPQGQQMSPQMQQMLAMMAAGVPPRGNPGSGGTG